MIKERFIDNEHNLAEAIASGNETAFEFIYKHYFPNLCLYSNKFIDDLTLAEDIVQDCIYTIWEQRHKLSHITNIKSYLYKSVHNKCINHINHLKVRNRYASEAAYQLKKIELEKSDSLIIQEMGEVITEAIDKLPEKSRMCFQLKRIDGLSQKEISEKLGITEKAVEANISRALKQLRHELRDCLDMTCIMVLIIFLIKLLI